jgi:hypothetical protein
MKKLISVFVILYLTQTIAAGQTTFNYNYCNCKDEIAKIEPLLNGKFLRTCKGKEIISGNFVNGKKDGLWITKSKNGTIIRKINYVNGVLDKSIEYFYSSGAPKLKGQFDSGKKVGQWIYYNEKGKVIKEGSFNDGKAIGIWKMYDLKGKKELVIYDFDKDEYLMDNSTQSLMEPSAILQNDNSAEWLIRQTHQVNNNAFKTKPFEGYLISSDFHVLLMEIPLEIWETYVSYNFSAKLKFEDQKLSAVSVQFGDSHLNDVPEIGFFAVTNNQDKLTKVEHNELTIKLLTMNLEEAIWVMGPWIIKDEEIDLYLPYVINEFANSPYK